MNYAEFIKLEENGTPLIFDGRFVDLDSGLKKGVCFHQHFEFFTVGFLSAIQLVDVRYWIKWLGVIVVGVFCIVQQCMLSLFCYRHAKVRMRILEFMENGNYFFLNLFSDFLLYIAIIMNVSQIRKHYFRKEKTN